MEEQSRETEARAPVDYGELHLLLGDIKDESTGYRRREAAWISIIVHGVIVLALLFVPKWWPNSVVVVVPVHEKNDTIFVAGETAPKVKTPQTNKVSDQNRIAQTPIPAPSKETLRKFIDPRRSGMPQPAALPPQPQQQQAMQGTPAPPQAGSPVAEQPQTKANLEAPQPRKNPFALSSPGSAVDQAIRSAANSRVSPGVTFGGGEMGSGVRPKVDTRGALDILSDTRGVDFGPYMKRLHVTVEEHWYPLIPEVALPPMMKKGSVVIEFAIMKDGGVQDAHVVISSGDLALDRAAYGAILNAVPLPRLPLEFPDPYLRIRATFFYNPDKNELN